MAVLVRLFTGLRKHIVSGLTALLVDRLSATRATLIAIICSFFEMFDVPVYWPILVVYWFVLFLLTMRRQIQYVRPLSISCAWNSLWKQTHGQV